jgi:hypothetical protein
VTRQGSDGDRRRVMHVLTDAGRKVLDDADAAIEARLETIAGELSEPDNRRAFRGLDVWGRALDSYRSKQVASASQTPNGKPA